ncbi:hypothetical protein ABU614_08765 [Lysobacter firmicutimachus]|uniref:Uncharacterized protein n=1 Tax=Lysobacter firmicutimachus TaxID=1792846 RepID=A0AAU8MXD2_9GAMM
MSYVRNWSFLVQASIAIAVIAAGAAALPAGTAHTAVVGDIEYGCPNGCLVSDGPSGPVVKDAGGSRMVLGHLKENYSVMSD